jgi:hypothetical protein
MLGSYRVKAQMMASQEGLSSMELVFYVDEYKTSFILMSHERKKSIFVVYAYITSSITIRP